MILRLGISLKYKKKGIFGEPTVVSAWPSSALETLLIEELNITPLSKEELILLFWIEYVFSHIFSFPIC